MKSSKPVGVIYAGRLTRCHPRTAWPLLIEIDDASDLPQNRYSAFPVAGGPKNPNFVGFYPQFSSAGIHLQIAHHDSFSRIVDVEVAGIAFILENAAQRIIVTKVNQERLVWRQGVALPLPFGRRKRIWFEASLNLRGFSLPKLFPASHKLVGVDPVAQFEALL